MNASDLLAYYLHRLGLSCYRRQLVFYCRQAGAPQPPPQLPDGFEFRFVKPGELESLHYPGGWLKLPAARQWLERGDSDMLASIQGGRICSYLWVERHIARIDYLDLEARLPPGHVYISKVLVLPQWRRHGLARAMYQFILSREPSLTMHSACVKENLPMLRLFAQLQWGPRLILTVWKLAFLRWYRVERTADGSIRRHVRAGDLPAELFGDD